MPPPPAAGICAILRLLSFFDDNPNSPIPLDGTLLKGSAISGAIDGPFDLLGISANKSDELVPCRLIDRTPSDGGGVDLIIASISGFILKMLGTLTLTPMSQRAVNASHMNGFSLSDSSK
jgi:hypothetical protein